MSYSNFLKCAKEKEAEEDWEEKYEEHKTNFEGALLLW